MKVGEKNLRSVWWDNGIKLIDQRRLPHDLEIFEAKNIERVCYAIKEMVVRGAPAIGATAAYGMILGKDFKKNGEMLKKTRPTAKDLFYAVDYMLKEIEEGKNVLHSAERYVNGIIAKCKKIGEIGKDLIHDGYRILTHCNAGALATVDWGTALAPIRMAKDKNIFVYVDETRPRMQGSLTSWELEQEGIDHAVIVDNAAGYFMQKGKVDVVIVGADRIALNGDVANKIGTYEKAVVAKENGIPFYVAAPTTTFDMDIENGSRIEIEERSDKEVIFFGGKKLFSQARNPAFDITPARYITGIITEEELIKPGDISKIKMKR